MLSSVFCVQKRLPGCPHRRKGANESKRKTGAAGLSFLPFSGSGMVSDAVFLRLCRTVRVMEPEIPTGSVVVVDGRKKEWNPGDVITYRRGNMVVTHRIVEKSEEGYCTKGDANAEEDAGIVLEKQVIGNVIVALPWLGFGIVWLRQRGTLFFLAVGAVMLFTIRQLWHGRKIMQENKL